MFFFLMYINCPGSIFPMSQESKIGAFSFLLLALFLIDTLRLTAKWLWLTLADITTYYFYEFLCLFFQFCVLFHTLLGLSSRL